MSIWVPWSGRRGRPPPISTLTKALACSPAPRSRAGKPSSRDRLGAPSPPPGSPPARLQVQQPDLVTRARPGGGGVHRCCSPCGVHPLAWPGRGHQQTRRPSAVSPLAFPRITSQTCPGEPALCPEASAQSLALSGRPGRMPRASSPPTTLDRGPLSGGPGGRGWTRF